MGDSESCSPFVLNLVGNPVWRADTSIWKSIQTFYWPGTTKVGMIDVIKILVSHNTDVVDPTVVSQLRIVDIDNIVVAEMCWTNTGYRPIWISPRRIKSSSGPSTWEICIKHDNPSDNMVEGQVHSIYIATKGVQKRSSAPQLFRRSHTLRVPPSLLQNGQRPIVDDLETILRQS